MSFNREVNGACRDRMSKEMKNNEYQTVGEEPSGEDRQQRGHDLFHCADFERFLGSDPPQGIGSDGNNDGFLSKDDDFLSKDAFLSKDLALPSMDFGSVFNSREAFSELLKSEDWSMKFSPPGSSAASIESQTKTFPAESEPTSLAAKSTLTSRDWLPFGNLGNHVDVSYNKNMFGASGSSAGDAALPVAVSPPKYDWDKDFFSQLQLPPQPKPPPSSEASAKEEPAPKAPPVAAATAEPKPQNQTPKTAPKRKRVRKPRKKVLPKVFRYVEPLDADILLGRGGRSNHHPGNKRYREEVKNLQNWYKGIDDKDEKTDLSQCLVDYVHSYGGRFLEKDQTGWYIVPNIVARRKASQALREDNDPEKRAAKRARFLKRRAETAQGDKLKNKR